MIESINLNFINPADLKSVTKRADVNVDNNLFRTDKAVETQNEQDNEKALLEAERVSYENELKTLEAEKSVKEADKKALESQKAALQTKVNGIQAEIKSNDQKISKYTGEVTAMNDTIVAENSDIDDLQKQYDEANKEAQELSNKMNETILKLINNSNNNIKEQKALIEQVTQEAYDKVASGEIDENEVPQYVAQKTGNAVTTNSASSFSAINSMSAQMKALISQATNILSTITSKQSNVNNLQGQILVGNEKIAELNTANTKKYQEKSSVKKDIDSIDKEILRTTNEINVIDANINQVNNKIAAIEAKMNPEAANEQNSGFINNNFTKVITGTTVNAKDSDYEAPVLTVNNPFVAVANNDVDYSSLVEALDTMSQNIDLAVSTARTQDNKNNQELRELFQGLLK